MNPVTSTQRMKRLLNERRKKETINHNNLLPCFPKLLLLRHHLCHCFWDLHKESSCKVMTMTQLPLLALWFTLYGRGMLRPLHIEGNAVCLCLLTWLLKCAVHIHNLCVCLCVCEFHIILLSTSRQRSSAVQVWAQRFFSRQASFSASLSLTSGHLGEKKLSYTSCTIAISARWPLSYFSLSPLWVIGLCSTVFQQSAFQVFLIFCTTVENLIF